MTTFTFPRSTPEAQGIDSRGLLEFVQALDSGVKESHSMMLVRHGQVVAEGWWHPYGPARYHQLYSLSKSFCSTAAGFAAAEGLLTLDDKVVDYFPEEAPAEISPNLATLRIRDLLTMTTGHDASTIGPASYKNADGSVPNWAKIILHQPIEHEPGTHFVYNSGATYLVAAILAKVTGQTLLEYLGPRLFEPLGIENPRWENSPQGINIGGWGMSIRTEDIARFGQLYLQKGVWQGKRLLPEGWVEEATAKQVPNGTNPESDWNQGYGYQFWRCRHGIYRGDGAFGQFCIVFPEQDAVLALTSATPQLQNVLNIVWEKLLPLFGPSPLPESQAAEKTLRNYLSQLRLPAPGGAVTSPLAETVSGRAFTFPENDWGLVSASCIFAPEGNGSTRLHLHDNNGAHEIIAGSIPESGEANWIEVRTAFASRDGVPSPVDTVGAWVDDHTYVARLCFVETPFCPTLTFTFAGDGSEVTLEYRPNVTFGPSNGFTVTGKANAPVSA